MLYMRRAHIKTVSVFPHGPKTVFFVCPSNLTAIIKIFAVFILIQFIPGLLVEYLC